MGTYGHVIREISVGQGSSDLFISGDKPMWYVDEHNLEDMSGP